MKLALKLLSASAVLCLMAGCAPDIDVSNAKLKIIKAEHYSNGESDYTISVNGSQGMQHVFRFRSREAFRVGDFVAITPVKGPQ